MQDFSKWIVPYFSAFGVWKLLVKQEFLVAMEIYIVNTSENLTSEA